MLTEKINLIEGRSDITLTAYVLDDLAETSCGKPRPAVLVCPGGAYIFCSDREAEPIAIRYNAMGYHAFVLRYSVYSENKPMPFGEISAPKKWLTYPEPVRDIARAFIEIGKHADAWHVDMSRVAICGFSAGAHNCAMYSVYWNSPMICDHLGVSADMLKPAASILSYTLSDYVYMKDKTSLLGERDLAFFKASNTAFLGTGEPTDAQLDEVSPARHVTKDTPPTFLWATAEDSMVPVQHTLRMATALADAGVPFETHIFEEGPHGLALGDRVTATPDGKMTDNDAAKWVGLAEAWLKKRF